MKFFYKVSFLIFLWLSFSSSLKAQTILVAGDIAVIGLNADDDDFGVDLNADGKVDFRWAIVALRDLSAGTVIHFTDASIKEDGHFYINLNNEGHLTWTLTSRVRAGTLLAMDTSNGVNASDLNGAGTTGKGGLSDYGTTSGWLGGDALNNNFSIPNTGDQIIIYQGTAGTSTGATFIYALSTSQNGLVSANGGWQTSGSVTGQQQSYLPLGLTNGTTAVALTTKVAGASSGTGIVGSPNYGFDNMVYKGITTGTQSQLLAAIGNPSNWAGDDSVPFPIGIGSGFTFANHFTLPPTLVSATFSDTNLSLGKTAVVTFVFSTEVTGFTVANLTVPNGNIPALASTDGGRTWKGTFTPSENTTDDNNFITVNLAGVTSISGALVGTGTASSENYSVDTQIPTVVSVNSSSANGTYKVGDVLSIQVNFSESVTVTGTPQLTLETGATDRTINYASGSGTNTLTFNYTIQSGDLSADLDYTSTTALALNGGTIKDAATNNATLTLASPGTAGSLGANKAIVVDGVMPRVMNVTSSSANGTYKVGAALSIQVNFSESVTVTGTPQLTLETGATDRTINYASGSGTNTLTFNYTIQSGDVSADLDYTSTTALALNGGTIKDAASNNAVLTLASPGTANSLGNNKSIVVDGVAPTVTSVTVPANGTYKTGDNLNFTVNFNEAVTVNTTGGTPRIALAIGTTVRYANYVSGSETSALTFTYTVVSGDADNNGITVGGLNANGGTLQDAAGNNATLTLNSIGSTSSVLVDGVVPRVTNVSSPTGNATYKVGNDINIVVSFSEVVTVTGTPQLTLETGTTDRTVDYVGGSGTSNLSFSYRVNAGDNTEDLDYVSTSALALNGGTIRDAAGNNAVLTLPSPGDAGSLGANKDIIIDTKAPTLIITTDVSFLKVGETANITFTFSELVASFSLQNFSVTHGTLTNLTATASPLIYTATFTPTSNVSGVTANITVPAGSYADLVSNAGEEASLSTIQIDTKVPTLLITSNTLSLKAGETATLSFTFSKPPFGFGLADVMVTNGTLSGLQATADPLVYTITFTPTANINGATATVSVAAGAYQDAAGNNGSGASTGIQIDTQAPTTTVTSVSFSDDKGLSNTDLVTNAAAQTVSGILNANLLAGENVYVSFNNGVTTQVATTVVGTNTWSLAGVTLTGNGTILAYVTDAAGNKGAVVSTGYSLDQTAPTVVISSADVAPGATIITSPINFSVTLSEPVANFSAGSFTLTNGSISGFAATANPRVYNFTFTPTNYGNVTIDILANKFIDIAGNGNVAASQFTFNYQQTLPVSLIDFVVKKEADLVRLQWQTASEQNNKGFIIYRSGDDKNFVEIGSVIGKGMAFDYTFLDKKPLNGNNYYKLVQQDLDGKEVELGIKDIAFNFVASGVKVYPNPVISNATVMFDAGKYNALTLVSIDGRVLQTIHLTKLQTEVNLNVAQQAAGIYLVRFLGENTIETVKLIKQ